jgi:hypothetical protein
MAIDKKKTKSNPPQIQLGRERSSSALRSLSTPRVTECRQRTPPRHAVCVGARTLRWYTHSDVHKTPPPRFCQIKANESFSLSHLDSHGDGEGRRGGLLRRVLALDGGGLGILRGGGLLLLGQHVLLYFYKASGVLFFSSAKNFFLGGGGLTLRTGTSIWVKGHTTHFD